MKYFEKKGRIAFVVVGTIVFIGNVLIGIFLTLGFISGITVSSEDTVKIGLGLATSVYLTCFLPNYLIFALRHADFAIQGLFRWVMKLTFVLGIQDILLYTNPSLVLKIFLVTVFIIAYALMLRSKVIIFQMSPGLLTPNEVHDFKVFDHLRRTQLRRIQRMKKSRKPKTTKPRVS